MVRCLVGMKGVERSKFCKENWPFDKPMPALRTGHKDLALCNTQWTCLVVKHLLMIAGQ